MATFLPRVAIPLPEPGKIIDPLTFFPAKPQAVWLEIGFGGGEHLAAQAKAHPEIGFIGCEVFLNGVASLLNHLELGGGGENVRVCSQDARLLLPSIKEASIERMFVLFPDPWPKKRHAERRFIGPDNLPLISRLLADGGILRVASDQDHYIAWALEHVLAHPDFELLVHHKTRPADWPPTRYEQKALRQGDTCDYLEFKRKAR
jgi:tRNA (guanine-N7-)-methyltransferase